MSLDMHSHEALKTINKKFKYVPRSDMYKFIRKRMKEEYDIDISKDTISKVLDIYDDELFMIIASMKCFWTKWGVIGGTEKPPRRLTGHILKPDIVKENHGYGKWRLGVPFIWWSTGSYECEKRSAKEYFEQDSIILTDKAYEFRKQAGLPDPTEEEIQAIKARLKETNNQANNVNSAINSGNTEESEENEGEE